MSVHEQIENVWGKAYVGASVRSEICWVWRESGDVGSHQGDGVEKRRVCGAEKHRGCGVEKHRNCGVEKHRDFGVEKHRDFGFQA